MIAKMELVHADQVGTAYFDTYSLYNQMFVLDSVSDSHHEVIFKLTVVLACSFIVLIDDLLLLVLIIMILYTAYIIESLSLFL